MCSFYLFLRGPQIDRGTMRKHILKGARLFSTSLGRHTIHPVARWVTWVTPVWGKQRSAGSLEDPGREPAEDGMVFHAGTQRRF